MSITTIINELTKLQTKIPEEIFKIKEQLTNTSLKLSKKEIKQHPYVVSLLQKSRDIRKRNRYLEEQLLQLLLKGREVIVIDDKEENITISTNTTHAVIIKVEDVEEGHFENQKCKVFQIGKAPPVVIEEEVFVEVEEEEEHVEEEEEIEEEEHVEEEEEEVEEEEIEEEEIEEEEVEEEEVEEVVE